MADFQAEERETGPRHVPIAREPPTGRAPPLVAARRRKEQMNEVERVSKPRIVMPNAVANELGRLEGKVRFHSAVCSSKAAEVVDPKRKP